MTEYASDDRKYKAAQPVTSTTAQLVSMNDSDLFQIGPISENNKRMIFPLTLALIVNK